MCSCVVTNDTRHFSQYNGDQRLPHVDLEPLFRGKSRYATSIVEVVRDILEDLFEDHEWNHIYDRQPRKLSEILDAEHLLCQQVWYNRHWDRRIAIEDGEIK